jgi:hypothetical protein
MRFAPRRNRQQVANLTANSRWRTQPAIVKRGPKLYLRPVQRWGAEQRTVPMELTVIPLSLPEIEPAAGPATVEAPPFLSAYSKSGVSCCSNL